MVIQRGTENKSRSRATSEPHGYRGGVLGSSGPSGWTDGPWWREEHVRRNLGVVAGLKEGSRLARVSAEAYAKEFFDVRGGVEGAAKRAAETLTQTNPTRSSDIFLAIQAVSLSREKALFAGGVVRGDGSTSAAGEEEEEEDQDEEVVCFAIYLHDPLHSLSFSTLSQPFPAKWAQWLDANSNDGDLPESIQSIIASGGLDPREWVAEWIEEILSLGVGVVAQRRCYEKNKRRFQEDQPGGKKRVQRHAYVLRTWTGYHYSEQQMLSLRAMINELSLKSGGQYDVHLLVHVKDDHIPIWASPDLYQKTLQENVPKEFWNISTLWSERLMETYYPEPFPDNFANMAGAGIHGVYRSAHFALQWFSQQRSEYDFYWNWEMDLRYTGHYWEFNEKIGEWGKKQPRKGMWERSRRFWIPEFHGDFANFTQFVETETREKDVAANDLERSGPVPIWGPVQDFPHTGMLATSNATVPPSTYEEDNYSWGVDEDADLLVFNPLFDPALTNWVFSWDVTGYNRSLPIPPRRAAAQ